MSLGKGVGQSCQFDSDFQLKMMNSIKADLMNLPGSYSDHPQYTEVHTLLHS